ncbi:MAG: GTPase [archaeon]
MPINAGHEYLKVEKEYLNSDSLEDKIYWLEEMIRAAPKHKGSENLLKELRIRLKKFNEKLEKGRKKSGGRKGIRKEGYQFVLVGKTNSGKSSLLNRLTNSNSKVGEFMFTTREPVVGTFQFEGISAQIVDIPSVGCEQFDVGLVNNADSLLIVVEDLAELSEIEEWIKRSRGKRIIVVNKIDELSENEKKKLIARLKSKRIDGFVVSAKAGDGIEELKGRLLRETGMIRIYLKEPGKNVNKNKPLVLERESTVRDVAEHILKGFFRAVKRVKISGPSSKFAGQVVGLKHKVRDLDVVEFHTR